MTRPLLVPGVLFLTILVMLSFMTVYAIDVRPDNAGAIELYNAAVDEATAGRFEETVNLTDQALSLQPNFTLALVTRTGALLELNRIEEAKKSLDAARTLEPEDTAVLSSAASYSLRIGDFQDAVRYASLVIEKDPQVIEAWIIKGTAHGEMGEYQEEINVSTLALQIAPENTKLQSNLQYASGMMKNDKKSPILLSTILLSLFCGALLLYAHRR